MTQSLFEQEHAIRSSITQMTGNPRVHTYGAIGVINEFYLSTLKSGKQGRRVLEKRICFTPLYQCQICLMVSTPKKVSSHSEFLYFFAEGKKDISFEPLFHLCLGCVNKLRAIEHKRKKLNENENILKELRKAIRDEKRINK